MATGFLHAVLTRQAAPEEIDDWIDRWHDGDGLDMSLDDFLGMTWEEYSRWAMDPNNLESILDDHRYDLDYFPFGSPYHSWKEEENSGSKLSNS